MQQASVGPGRAQRAAGINDPRRTLSNALLALSALGSGTWAEASTAQSNLAPSAGFVQIGTAGATHEFTTGLTWDWCTEWRLLSGRVTGYWETSVSGWSYPAMDARRTAWLGKIGLIPVFRYEPAGGSSRWFVEGGVGLTFTSTLYQTDRKRFATRFNFGDHLAVGFVLGTRRQHELALRVEHLSNAGIKRPNPGEDFVQLRYSYRLP